MNSIKLLLLLLIITTSTTIMFAQYAPLYKGERGLVNYNSYDSYTTILNNYNATKNLDTTIYRIDSLSLTINKRKNAQEYLFLRNELANFHKFNHDYNFSFDVLDDAMSFYKKKNDTINIEYATSLEFAQTVDDYENKSYNKSYYLLNRISILKKLNNVNKSLSHAYVNYANYLKRTDKFKAMNMFFNARTSAIANNDIITTVAADYGIITNIEGNDLQSSELRVILSDLDLLNSEKRSLPINVYSAYYNYIAGQRYADSFDDYYNGIKYYNKSQAIIHSIQYPLKNLEASNHSELANCYSRIDEEDSLWVHFNAVYQITIKEKMSNFNKGLALINIAEASLKYSSDSSLQIIEILKKDTNMGQYFEDRIIDVESKAYYKKNEFNKTIEIVNSAFENHDIIDNYKIPVISESLDYNIQISLLNTILNSYLKTENYTPLLINSIIGIQSLLYMNLSQDETYSTEIAGYSKGYNKSNISNLKYLFSNNSVDNNKVISEIIFSSKAMQMQSFMNKNKSLSKIDNDSNAQLLLLHNNANLSEINELLNQDNISEASKDSLLKMQNTYFINNLMTRHNAQYQNTISLDYYTTPSISQVKDKLNENDGILEYVVDDTSIVYSFITKDTAIFNIINDININRYISKHIYSIKTGRKAPNELSNMLFIDIEKEIAKLSNLVIITDRRLSKIPFETFRFPSTGEYFVNTINVSYSLGTSYWYSQDYNANYSNNSIISIAPFVYKKQNDNGGLMAVRTRNGFSLPTLYYSEDEIIEIDSIFNANSLQSKYYIDKDAIEVNLKPIIDDYDIVHIASHAFVDNVEIEKSAIFLYQEPIKDIDKITNDNLLTLGEIYNIKMNANLVVISTCSSGSGNYAQGEGLIAFPRAFIISGSKNVIASLWPVNDIKTKELLTKFYSILISQSVSYGEALRLAKKECINNGFLTLDWAGFVLIH